MVLTFPNMGNLAIAAGALCQGLGIPYVMPEENNKHTLQRGAYHAPEEICLPFKLMLGNFIECIERGADTILLTGSCGPCRFGEYCELAMRILRKLGYDPAFIVADLSKEVGRAELFRRIGRLSAASGRHKAAQIKALITAYRVARLCDDVEALAHARAGREAEKGACRRLLYACKAAARRSQSPHETLHLLRAYRKKLARVPLDRRRTPVKITIIGEIFTVIDPYSNLFIEDKLMELGVSSERMLTPSWWVRDLLLRPVKLNSFRVNRAARRHLPYTVGGHGRECVGEAALAKRGGADGAIQIFPLGCMPEIVAKSILPSIEREQDFPIMTLVVDEVAGEAGYTTRIEAFLDMLINRRRRAAARPPEHRDGE